MATSKKTRTRKTTTTRAPRKAKAGGGGRGGSPPDEDAGNGSGGGGDLDASLQEETRRRYLTYAMSVITSRALPDVRDGLKPVQRRILYAMYHDEHLHADSKHRKSAKVVGSVIGKYHPHGDTAVYDAMVRMAQDFSMRLPLVDGSGNFGSLDGDSAAAYRYTECRMAPAATELVRELKQDTVDFRPNFDGTADEPIVLPARFPNLLVNGTTGIAVGMATNIPPHNLKEVTDALVALTENRELTTTNLLKYIKGPDFPTGGQILNSKVELRKIYDDGSGAIKLRAQYKTEKKNIVITSIPYAVNKATVVERIADVIIARKLPQLVDVRDESTTDVRIVLETKKDADPAMVMAYLFKHTPLQLNFNVNMTVLVPAKGGAPVPAKVGIKELLTQFLDFRYDTIRRRFEYELEMLRRRIHILEGFITIFDALDEAIRIIRRSDGKKDAAGKLMKRFGLDDVQTDAILEMKLYKLAKLEILALREELGKKRAEAKRIAGILKSPKKMWTVVRTELQEVADKYGDKRRTAVGGAVEEVEFDADAYIVDEDCNIVVTRDGWIKRVREVKDPSKARVREGDAVTHVLGGSTKEHIAFFTNMGSAYVTKLVDIPATTGYGNPIQKFFKFKDKERIVAAFTLDPRTVVPEELLCISAGGYGSRFAVEPFLDATTRTGRRFAKVGKGDEIIDVQAVTEEDVVITGSRNGHVLLCTAEEINYLENPGKGVYVLKVTGDDQVIAFTTTSGKGKFLEVETVKGGKKHRISADRRTLSSRGGKGRQIVSRAKLAPSETDVIVVPVATADGGEGVH